MTRPLTSLALLSVAFTVHAVAQCPDGTPPPCGLRQAPPSPRSIAVLPFANRSPDSADVYLAEGMTDEVGSHLTQVSRLQVKARGVVAAAWQRNPDPLGAARALRVAWYVHGTVRHVPPQLLVSIELVRPATGEEVWARRFARSDADVFAAQAEVAESVAVVVGGRLSPAERTALARRPTRNNQAYRLYLYGNALLGRRTQLDVRRAVDAYTEAVRLDPRFAAAWARLGMARAIQHSWSWSEGVPRDTLLAMAFAAARHAVRLDSMSGEAWLALGAASSNAGDLGNAESSYRRSLGLDSLNPEALHFAGVTYAVDGNTCLDIPDAAAPLLRRALALDPGLRNTWRHLALVSRDAGRLVEAEALLDTALAFGPWAAFYNRAYVRFLRGNAVGALADLAEGERLDSAPAAPDLRALYTVLRGDSAPARAVLARLRSQADSGQPVFATLARFEITLGNQAGALSALERLRSRVNPNEPRCSPTAACSASRDTWLALHDPIFAPLRGDPRFQRLWQETRPVVPWLEGYH